MTIHLADGVTDADAPNRLTVDDVKRERASPHTLRSRRTAYASWISWRRLRGLLDVEATPHHVAQYVVDLAQGYTRWDGTPQPALRPDSIGVYVTGIGATLVDNGFDDVTTHHDVVDAMDGLRRKWRADEHEQALPFDEHAMRLALFAWSVVDGKRMRRDVAMLLVGFHGALRASELTSLRMTDVAFDDAGCILTLRQPKGSPHGVERVALPYMASGAACPVVALRNYLDVAQPSPDGPVFRESRGPYTFVDAAASVSSVTRMVQRAALVAGLPDHRAYSAHSLRRGCATALARAGVPLGTIQRHLRHKRSDTTQGYIDRLSLDERPTSVLFQQR